MHDGSAMKEAGMEDNVFTIEDGRALKGYPRAQPDDSALEWPEKEARDVDMELFVENAHFLFENREKIFADSRMFLAPVNIMSGAAYIGPLVKPTVGTYLEWWLRRGREELAFFVSGSPLSGANASRSVAKDGSVVPLPKPGMFLNLVKEFTDAHRRYLEERKKYEVYSLLEVILRLKGIDPNYEDAVKARLLARRSTALEKTVEILTRTLEETKRRCRSWKDKYKTAAGKTGLSSVRLGR